MEDENERIDQLIIEGSEMRSLAVLIDVAKSICKIKYINKNNKIMSGTGFFIKIERKDDNDPLFCLMSNEHVISKEVIKSKTELEIFYDNQHQKIKLVLDKDLRFIRDYRYLNIDAVIVEIFPEEVQQNYFLLPNIEYIGENYAEFKDELICIVQFPGGKDLNYSVGRIIDVKDYSNELTHLSTTKAGSSGSPIFIKESRHVLGIHRQGNIRRNENYGNFIKPIIDSIKLGLNYGKIKYNENEYEGEYKNSFSEGKGKITYAKSKEFYFGAWKEYKKHGKGILYYEPNKIKYIGDFSEDEFEGIGKLYDKNGNYYIGQFSLGDKFGQGKYYSKDNKLIYDGNFAFGKYNGIGKEIISEKDNFYYEGNYENGLMQGKGKLFFKNKVMYEGEFEKGNYVENGKIIKDNGQYYIGQFKDFKMEGKGILYNKDNSICYEGDFLNNKKHGFGKLYEQNGSYYEGNFKNDLEDGKGKIYDKNGKIIFDGFFKEGLMEGEGIYDDGNIHMEGTFKNGELNGKGFLTSKDGVKYEGEFVNGLKEGLGKLTTKDENYEGMFKNGKKNGFGIFHLNIKGRNHIYEGNFLDDKYDGEGELIIEGLAYVKGKFKNGHNHGEAKLYDKNHNLRYDGHFVNGEAEGDNEKKIYENGSFYIGQIRKGKRNGNGILYNKDNEIIYEGQYVNDKMEGKGLMYFEKRDYYYTGQFKDGKYNGEGQIYLTKEDRKVFDGNFVNGKMQGEGIIFYKDGTFKVITFEEGKEVGEAVEYIRVNGALSYFESVGNAIHENCFIY